MIDKQLKREFLEYLTDYINDFAYTDMDVFLDEHADDEGVEELMNIRLKVVEDK
jgi:hypothetical protein